MATDIYSSGQLIRTLDSLENQPITFFRDRWFPLESQSTDEKVYFDVLDKKRRLAPYVSPIFQGKIMEHRGFATRTFTPPYVKPKHVINPNDQFRRRAGEPLMGSMAPADRFAAQVATSLMEEDEAITMLEEVQASEALRKGQVTVTGDGYGTVVLSFGRDVTLTVALSGGDRWSETGVDPLANLEAWGLLLRQKSGGAIARDVVMGTDAWAAFKAKLLADHLKSLFDSLRGSESRIELGPRVAEKVKYEGQIGDFRFWTYSDVYQDEDGNEVEIMPPKEVVLLSGSIEGTRAYAAIRDVREMRPVRRYPKMWIEEDPPVEYLMTQASFLMVPLRPNASLGATVLT
jgi:hypothetical protein